MRPHCAIFVDVGYLIASASTRVTGTSLRRGVQVDNKALITGLIAQAEADSALPLLRVHWYDSGARPGGMPDFHQEEIGLLPRVKLRLGRLSHGGEQKGVDLRIGLDLATHGRNRVVDTIYLVSGDDDLTEAVEEAQVHGIQVIILAVPDHAGRPYAVAKHLQRAADGVVLIDAETIDSSVRKTALPEALVPAAEAPEGEAAEGAAEGSGDGAAPAAGGEKEADGTAPAAAAAKPAAPKPGPTPVPAAPAAPAAASATGADGIPAPTPSPTVLAKKKPTQILPPRPIWSSDGSGTLQSHTEGEITDAVIDEVARHVVTSWVATATPEQLVRLRADKPTIPVDLDRTLLLDLSTRSGVYYIDDEARHEIRNQFWRLVDSLKIR